MTARDDVRSKAALFSWSLHSDAATDTYLHGDKAIIAHYHKDGSLKTGELYTFFSINDMHLKDRAVDKNKKTQVISWLAEVA